MLELTAISAFTQRSLRRTAALQRALHSLGLVAGAVLLAAWILDTYGDPVARCSLCEGSPSPHPPTGVMGVLALADLLVLGTLALLLLIIAPAATAATVANERRDGTLDQLRTTPLSARALLAGLCFGAPAGLYLLCAAPLVFHIACGIAGVLPADTMLATTSVLLCGGMASVLFGLAVGLAPRHDADSTRPALAVAAILLFGGLIALGLASSRDGAPWAFFHPAGALQAALLEHDGLWRRLSVSSWSLDRYQDHAHLAVLGAVPLISSLAALGLGLGLGRAAGRKLAQPDRALLSKREALVGFTGIAMGLFLPLAWSGDAIGHRGGIALVFSVLLFALSAALAALASPSYETWALAVRGRIPARWHDDAAPANATVWFMIAVAAALLGTATGGFDELRPHERPGLLWALFVAATTPALILAWTTRARTPGARWGWGAALCVYLLCQVVAIALASARTLEAGRLVLQLLGLLAVAVPAVLVVMQERLRRQLKQEREERAPKREAAPDVQRA